MADRLRQGVDVVIVGQGLAGSTLAWWLHWLGCQIVLLDVPDIRGRPSASRVSAGLITPLSGLRFTALDQFPFLRQVAADFYRRVEQATNTRFFYERPALRLFDSNEETAKFKQRENLSSEYEPFSSGTIVGFRGEFGGVWMHNAARLDSNPFLDATERYFRNLDAYDAYHLTWPTDVIFHGEEIELPHVGIRTRRLVLCRGPHEALANCPLALPFELAQGEILEVQLKFPKLNGHDDTLTLTPESGPEVIHRGGVWVVRHGEQNWSVGATYDRDQTDGMPTTAGAAWILDRLRRVLPSMTEIEVASHRAAVRPTIRGRYPAVGKVHSTNHSVYLFNGLGSKGALMAPWVAQELAAHLVDLRHRIPPQVAIDERFAQRVVSHPDESKSRRLTDIAHAFLKEIIKPGDWAVDGTAGNGHDTLWLAQQTGPTGRVFTFDIQAVALQRTRERVEQAGYTNVIYCHRSHTEIDQVVRQDSDILHPIAVACFNLGYLPGGDKGLTTHGPSTVEALEQVVSLLRPEGRLSILAYTGHTGGREEAEEIKRWLDQSRTLTVHQFDGLTGSASPPVLYLCRKSQRNGTRET